MNLKPAVSLLPFFISLLLSSAGAQDVITLTWNDVVGISKQDNLDLKIQRQDYRHQKLNEWKSLSSFLPEISYQFQGVRNIERPVFVIPNFGEVRFGTEYNFTHVLQLQYPIFTGGARWANWRIQNHLKKSLEAQLRNREDSVVLQALEAYFNVMLSEALITVNEQAYEAANANFNRVEKFYREGAASKLDFLRAKSRLSSTYPQLTSARNSRQMALENLKFILNIDPEDSLVILDTLKQQQFLNEYQTIQLPELQNIALNNRPDLESVFQQEDVTSKQKVVAASRFLPSLVLNANVQHQAQIEDRKVTREDYVRSKSASLALQIPLFQGGERILNYQQARINDKKAEFQIQKLKRAIQLEVENTYNKLQEARVNLESLLQATEEAQEALRLANLTYQEGISTQLEVLNAQLEWTNSEVQYKQGIFQFNISQLQLLKAIGKINMIWKSN